MLLLALLNVLAIASARTFNITHLIVPEVVPPGQTEVEVECRYDANFTLLSWFKGLNEFFRYKPGAAPSTKSFPLLGVGRVELIACGPTACRLKLGSLTEEATGLYRCDIERDVPPQKFETRTAYMEVQGHEHRRPLLEGLATEFEEGSEMRAYCRGAPDAEIRWYINGREVEDLRGSHAFKRTSTRLLFFGQLPMITIQCAEYRYGKLSGSNQQKAVWKDMKNAVDDRAQEQRKSSSSTRAVFSVSCILVSIFCLLQ